MKPVAKISHTDELLIQIRDALLEGNDDRKTIKGYERAISQNITAIREGRTGSEARQKNDPLNNVQRSTVNEVKRRFKERRIANPCYSQLSVAKEVSREYKHLGRPTGFDNPLSLNHRAWLEIKREDLGLPPF